MFGSATIDITPPVGIELFGYHRRKPCEGILDRLYATAMAFQHESTTVIMLSVDHIGLIVPQADIVRRRIADAVNLTIEQIMLLFTHTHSGADTEAENDLSRGYFQTLIGNLVHVAQQALHNMQSCHVGWGMTYATIGVNRRVHGSDGKARMGINPDGVIDQRIGVLSITDHATDELLGAVVVCTAHANILKSDNMLISGDFPGWTRNLLSDVLNCPVMVVIGSAGDCNARWRGGVPELRRMSWALSGAVLDVLSTIEPEPLHKLRLQSTCETFRLQDVPDPQKAEDMADEAAINWDIDTQFWLDKMIVLHEQNQRSLSVDVFIQMLEINNGVLAGVPVEPFADIALKAASAVGNELFFLLGYTNGYIGYLPTAAEIPYGGYEIEWMPIVYGLDTGFYMPFYYQAEAQLINTLVDMVL